MHRLALLILVAGMTACAAPTPRLASTEHDDLAALAPAEGTASLFRSELSTPEDKASPASMLLARTASPRSSDNWIGNSYSAIKIGTFEGSGDLSQQSTGLYSELIFGRELFSFLAIEGVAGYMQADGPVFDVWGIPLFAQARFSMPILVVEPYIGAGIGGFYADVKSTNAAISTSDFVAAGNAFIGIEAGIGNLAIGIEAKYIATEKFNSNFAIEGTSVMLSATLPF